MIATFLAMVLSLLGACRNADDPSPTFTPIVTPAAQASSATSTDSRNDAATATPDSAAVESALLAVQAFDSEDLSTIAALNEIVVDDAGVVTALAPHLASSDDETRWAALYVIALLADSDEDVELLALALEDSVTSHRVIAAGSLAGLGYVDALPVLIVGLSDNASLPFDTFGREVKDLALEALTAFTTQAFEDPESWEMWWESVRDRLVWDGAGYVAP